MRKVVDDPRLIYKCCKLYYEEGLGQQEIADRMAVSRVSVCRLLKAGREQGMVVIQVYSPHELEYSRLGQRLEQLYGLKEAVVAENSPLDTRYDQQVALGAETIKLLETYLHDGDVVGVSMGMTLHTVCTSQRLNSSPIACTFVPLLGGISAGRAAKINVHSNQIAFNFAQLFGGEHIDCFAPAIFSDKTVLQGFMNEAPMRRVWQYYKQMKTAVMGIGIPDRAGSTMIKSGYITSSQLSDLVEQGVVGDLSLQFYDREGSTERFREFNDRVAGMPLEQLRTVENRIGIGSNVQKAEAIYGALRGGYINILVTDQDCAQRLIQMGEEHTQ